MKTPHVDIPVKTKAWWLHVAVGVSAAAALVSLTLEFGFDEPPLPISLLIATQLTAVAVYVFSRAYDVLTAADRPAALRACWLDGLLLVAAAGFLAVKLERSTTPVLKVSALYVSAMQAVLLVRLSIAGVRLHLMLSQTRLQPTRVMAITFLSLIVLGGIALSLPRATQRSLRDRDDFSTPRHLLNGFFTATSATCVTGLVVYDTGSDFTLFGQIVILTLIQAGGLGIMIFGSAFGMLAGRQLSLKQSLVLQDAISYRTLGQLRTMVVFIVILTFVAEGVGALLIYPMWQGNAPAGMRMFHSVFHSISAFCNAGFALQPDSLVPYRRTWQVYGCIMPLIVLGGLGFPVLHDLWRGLRSTIRRLGSQKVDVAMEHPGGPRHRFTLHTKIVLITTVLLVLVPTLCFVLFESFSTVPDPPPEPRALARADVQIQGPTSARVMMSEASLPQRFLDSFFYAVTCRTAGFNTVSTDVHSMSPASHLLAGILMFIGGSPASTAGGVKTVALAVLLIGVWSTLRGRTKVEALGRTIPDTIVRRAAVIVIVMFGAISAVTLLICVTEQVSLREALFETVSACGTVGLSTGLTPDLTLGGRVIIMVAMFAGRLGPLTVLIALAGRTRAVQYEYPTEQVGIG